jgi:hypothetical protein
MTSYLRVAGATGLMWFFANISLASPAVDSSIESPWAEVAALPAATASSSITEDESVQLVSGEEAAENGSATTDASEDILYESNTFFVRSMPQPSYYASAGAVILHRSRPASNALIVPNAGPGVIADGGDFGFGWDPGVDVLLGYRTSSGTAWEARYFADDNAGADPINYGAVGNVRIGSFSNFGATNLTATRYYTTLHSSELNYVREVNPRCDFLLGFRWIEVEDDVNFNIVFPAFNADYNFNENNHLYGAQVGTKLNMWELNSPLTLLGIIKAGIYKNFASNDFTLLPSTGGQFDGGLNDSRVAFVGEVNFTAGYQITQSISAYGGYQVLWLDNLALASDALAASTAASSQAVITDGTLIYNGAVAGVSFVW